MKTKKYLVSTLLASGLVFGAPAVSPALAQLKSLQPKTSWAISKVDKASQAGKSYCTLSRQYDDGVVLSVARNQAEEYSLAIDLQKDMFEMDKALKIQLEPGPGQLRAYDLMPVSTKAVVIRLGWDDGFFDTLSKSQVMKVRLGDNAYSFGMSDIVKGQGDLDACMKGLQGKDAPVTAAASTDVLSAAPVQMASGFEAGRVDAPIDQNALAAAKADVQKQEEKVLQDFAKSIEVQEAPKTAAEKTAAKSNINKSAKAADVKIAATEPTKAAALPKPAEPVQVAAAAAPVAAPAPAAPVQDPALIAEVSKLKADLTRLQNDNNSLQQKLDSAAKTAQQTAVAEHVAKQKELEQKIAKLEEVNSGLVKQIDTVAKVNAQKLSEENVTQAKIEAQIEAGQKQIAELEKANADLQQKLAQSAKAAAAAPVATAENAHSAQRIAALDAQVRDLEQKLAQANMTKMPDADAQKSGERVAALDAQVKDLQAKLANANAMIIQQTSAAGETGQKASKDLQEQQAASSKVIADLQAKNKELQQKLDETAKLAAAAPVAPKVDDAKVAALEAELNTLKAQNAKLQETIKLSQTKVAEAAFNAEGKSLKQIADLELRLEAAQKDNVTLSKQIDDLKNRQDDARLSLVGGNWDLEQATRRFNEAEREIRRLGLQLEKERTSCNREKAEIEQMLFDPAVTEDKQRQKFVALEAELNSLKEQVADQSKLVQGQVDARVKEKTASLEAERDRLQEQVMAMQVKTPIRANDQVANADVQKLRDENIMLKSEAERLRLQIADASSNGAVRADTVASMRLEVEDLKRQLAMKDTQARTYQNQLATTQRENSQIKTRLSSAAQTGAESVASIAPAAGSAAASGVAGRGPSYHKEEAKPVAVSASAKVGAFGKSDIETLLRQSGMSVNGMKKASGGLAGAENYDWNNGGKIKGAASVKTAGNFDAAVNQYIASQKAQCSGDFASVPSPADKGSRNITTYETACVSGSQSTSASILFFENNGQFVAISSQTDATDMDLAMDARDKLANAVRGM